MTPNFDRWDRVIAVLLAPLCIAVTLAARGLTALAAAWQQERARRAVERAKERRVTGSLAVVPDRRELR